VAFRVVHALEILTFEHKLVAATALPALVAADLDCLPVVAVQSTVELRTWARGSFGLLPPWSFIVPVFGSFRSLGDGSRPLGEVTCIARINAGGT
jgi:hypothetical protein